MKNEYGILMSTPMIQAYMAGTKNQTRRLKELDVINLDPDGWELDDNPFRANYVVFRRKEDKTETRLVLYPYGKVGGNLWFRETWTVFVDGVLPYIYKADCLPNVAGHVKWKPSLHMPRVAARFTPKLLSYRLERLQDITEDDAINEGLEILHQQKEYNIYKGYHGPTVNGGFTNPKIAYENLWDMLNSKPKKGKNGKIKPAYPWSSNPWVWVVEFERFQISQHQL